MKGLMLRRRRSLPAILLGGTSRGSPPVSTTRKRSISANGDMFKEIEASRGGYERRRSLCTTLENAELEREEFLNRHHETIKSSAGRLKNELSGVPDKHFMVMMGLGGVGKTALVVRYVTGRFLNEYDPTLEMTYEKVEYIGESQATVVIHDTCGNGDASYIRSGEAFIVVYSITERHSFEIAKQTVKLITETRKRESEVTVPILLVGNKRDLKRGRQIGKEEAQDFAGEYDCSFYETSAAENRNVREMFSTLVLELRSLKSSRERTQSVERGHGIIKQVISYFSPRRKDSPPW